MTTKRLQYVPTVRQESDLPAPGAFEMGTVFYVQASGQFVETDQADWVPVDLTDPNQYVSLSGDTMTGDLDMGTNKITNLPAPIDPTDASRKRYVDNEITSLRSYTNNLVSSAITDEYVNADGDSMTGDLNMSTNDVTNVGVADFSTVAGQTAGEGQLTWNADRGTLDLGMAGGNVTQEVGMEQYIRVKSASNSGLENGKVYYLVGSTGAKKTVELAQANTAATSDFTIGVATENTSGGGNGFVTTYGRVKDVPNALMTDLVEGEPAYLSHLTPGGLTSTPTPAPFPCVRVGFVLRKQNNKNELFISVSSAPTLGQICDVELTAPVAGQVLQLDSAGVWRNVTLP